MNVAGLHASFALLSVSFLQRKFLNVRDRGEQRFFKTFLNCILCLNGYPSCWLQKLYIDSKCQDINLCI
jgi:bacteriorhodopsin